MKCIKTIVSILLVLGCLLAEAQDPRFSQVYASPLHINPAFSGVFDGQFRVHLNYRSQWSSILGDVPFRTFAASVDGRYNIVGDDYLAFGGSILKDEAGDSHFEQYRVHANLSYLKQLSGRKYRTSDQYLVAGVQVGGGQFSLDYSGLWFSSQFDPNSEVVNTSIASGEIEQSQTDFFMDVNVGLLWYAIFSDNMSIYVGGSMFHMNEPNISFSDNVNESLYRRWIGHIGGEIGLSDHFSLLPVIMGSGQGPSMEIVVGSQVRYTNNDFNEVALQAGIFNRTSKKYESGVNTDALVFMGSFELNNISLGLSYDVNTSELKTASNYRGAFEISLRYIHSEKKIFRVQCPNF